MCLPGYATVGGHLCNPVFATGGGVSTKKSFEKLVLLAFCTAPSKTQINTNFSKIFRVPFPLPPPVAKTGLHKCPPPPVACPGRHYTTQNIPGQDSSK